MRLGWRHPRPNDFQSPDQRPLRDTFASLQQHMTWPHFVANVDVQAIGNTFVKRTITAVDDPYSLIRSNDDIQVPRDFDTWLFVGVVGILADPDGPCRGLAGWDLNGAGVIGNQAEIWTPAGAGDWRLQAKAVQPVKKGDALSVSILSSVAGNTVTGSRCSGFFLPMT